MAATTLSKIFCLCIFIYNYLYVYYLLYYLDINTNLFVVRPVNIFERSNEMSLMLSTILIYAVLHIFFSIIRIIGWSISMCISHVFLCNVSFSYLFVFK